MAADMTTGTSSISIPCQSSGHLRRNHPTVLPTAPHPDASEYMSADGVDTGKNEDPFQCFRKHLGRPGLPSWDVHNGWVTWRASTCSGVAEERCDQGVLPRQHVKGAPLVILALSVCTLSCQTNSVPVPEGAWASQSGVAARRPLYRFESRGR